MMEFLIWFVSCFSCALGYTYFFYKLNNLKFKFKCRIMITFVLGVIILTVLKFYNVVSISSYIFFLYYPILFYLIKPLKLKKLFFYIFIIWLIGVLLDFSSMLIISLFYFVFKVDIYNIVFVLIPSIYVCIMLILLGNSKIVLKITNILYKIFNKIKYINFMLISFTILMFVIGIILAMNIKHINIGIMACVVALLTIIIFALLLRTKYNELEQDIFVEILRKNNDFYINMDKEQRIFKHNLTSKLLSVESVSNQKARLLLQDLIKEFNSKIDYSQKIENIPYGLDGIINEKIYPFRDNIEIKIDNKIEFDLFEVLKPRRYNVLVEKISLMLDNALEACVDSIDKILIIDLYEEDNQILIEIKNTFKGNMDVDEIGKVNFSSKGKKRGLGLYSALRNNEVNLDVKVVNNMFIAKLSTTKNLNEE